MSSALTTGSISYAQTYGERPDRGTVGMACLILAESALFIIFVVAYVYYIGRSLSGPTPREVLQLPVTATICLLSSSYTVHAAVAALRRGASLIAELWLLGTLLLGFIFLCFTAYEWYDLIANKHLTIKTNLFGTTFYSLVGLHATHVIVGLLLLSVPAFAGLLGELESRDQARLEVLSYYWHFVDAVWIVVLSTIYVFGR